MWKKTVSKSQHLFTHNSVTGHLGLVVSTEILRGQICQPSDDPDARVMRFPTTEWLSYWNSQGHRERTCNQMIRVKSTDVTDVSQKVLYLVSLIAYIYILYIYIYIICMIFIVIP